MIEDLKSEPLFVMRLDVGYDDVQRVGQAPAGNRAIFPVHGGSFEGARLKGRVLPNGADWVLWRTDGSMHIDVRLALETDDGAIISMAYVGIAYARTPEAAKLFARREVAAYDQLYVRTTPRFETSDPRYDWLNRTIAVANGTRTEDGPIYQVFEIQ
jgi:hypothetical protein